MERREGHTITGAFVFLLLGVFAVAATIMVLMGVRFYRSQTLRSQEINEYRILSSYIRTMLRSRDEDSLVGIDEIEWSETSDETGEMEDGDGNEGNGGNDGNEESSSIQMLTMTEEFDGVLYLTRIYVYDGYLREWFSEVAYEFEPERGEKIFEAKDLRVQKDGDLIIATLTDTLGQEVEVRMSMRSKLRAEDAEELAAQENAEEAASQEAAGESALQENAEKAASQESGEELATEENSGENVA